MTIDVSALAQWQLENGRGMCYDQQIQCCVELYEITDNISISWYIIYSVSHRGRKTEKLTLQEPRQVVSGITHSTFFFFSRHYFNKIFNRSQRT